ncbi:MAG: NUDIX hydrolase [Patescibacteria group bacterium]|nr:NUDIX hydrolase [Patescibacteria group bacterium]MDD5715266.1 NUDIX hydrolase [Patescibacteria group bacterium]
MRTGLKKWKTVRSRIIFRNTYFSIHRDTVRLPTGELYDYFFSNKNGQAAVVLPIDAKGRIILGKEFRYPVGQVVYGLIGGSVEPGETPRHAAMREMKEETGFTPRSLTLLGTFFGNPGRSGSRFYAFCARGLRPGLPHPEHAEHVELEALSIRDVDRLVVSGKIVDPFLLAVLLLYKFSKKKMS